MIWWHIEAIEQKKGQLLLFIWNWGEIYTEKWSIILMEVMINNSNKWRLLIYNSS